MTVERFAISFERELAKSVRSAAAREPISAWLADAARRKLRAEAMLSLIAEYEVDHGEITEKELEAVRDRHRALRPPRRKPTKRRTRTPTKKPPR